MTLPRLLLATMFFGLSVAARAEVGIGASSDYSILVPITIKEHVILEPFLRFTGSDIETEVRTTSSDWTSIGIGVFGKTRDNNGFSFYYGARIADVTRDATTNVGGFPGSLSETRTEHDGYSVSPTFGFQYMVLDSLSIGAELGWSYEKLDEVTFSPVSSPTEGTITSERTFANIVIRKFF